MLCCLSVVGALYGAMYLLLRERKLPTVVMRVWFTVHLFVSLIVVNVGCHVFSFLTSPLHVMPIGTAQALSRSLKHVVFKYFFAPAIPHVHRVEMPGSLPFSVLKSGAVCACHCSFFDPLLFLFTAPLSFLWRGATFFKSSLLNLPLFGYVLKCTGYFPVYFANENSPSFHVNKEKQAAVVADVEAWLGKGNNMCFFPEGVMNRDPAVLTDFRLGSFNMILAHKTPLYYFVFYGDHEVWSPSWKGLPGFPADIYTYVGKYEYDPAKEDAHSLSVGLRAEMQSRLDDMLAKRKEREYKPWYVAPQKKEL
ncbi:putative mitochondrial acyltransferase [Leptomonas pyrrhocoris]|uniref:Putative mitochondrial acyltransferase n=1 Tax=Leptomonas pyrrhocoris TaxID=157538 RepID=A0A0M9G1R4_LEPPY|nr:putative mitochondrial acyltransferase [Leptomonas pyrrhocoris]KPA80630.1 putative mitochondrial acyltransferase [Leptomonas pyrrhocoris]|eukprot:XP_015659069.1 putative mitochondrial acyltransferase [Leptomonas pyrrhocoris]